MQPPVLIGSLAQSFHIPLDKKPRDIDIIGTYDSVINFAKSYLPTIELCYPIKDGKKMFIKGGKTIIEAEIAWEDGETADKIVEYHSGHQSHELNGTEARVIIPSLRFLYMLKMSHRYLKDSPFFLKTMRDIRTMRLEIGETEILVPLLEIYKQRMKETYAYAHPKLNQSKGMFFSNDGVEYVYDHDTIHAVMKHLEKPAFDYFKPDNNDVLCSKDMFFAASETIRNYAVLEESYVLAIERSQVPFNYEIDPKKSFNKALEKVCTSITSGWFREYSWEHYDDIQMMYDPNYVERFKAGLAAGLVKPYK